jgi:hypothetical protein
MERQPRSGRAARRAHRARIQGPMRARTSCGNAPPCYDGADTRPWDERPEDSSQAHRLRQSRPSPPRRTCDSTPTRVLRTTTRAGTRSAPGRTKRDACGRRSCFEVAFYINAQTAVGRLIHIAPFSLDKSDQRRVISNHLAWRPIATPARRPEVHVERFDTVDLRSTAGSTRDRNGEMVAADSGTQCDRDLRAAGTSPDASRRTTEGR